MADALASGASDRKVMWVQVPSSAPIKRLCFEEPKSIVFYFGVKRRLEATVQRPVIRTTTAAVHNSPFDSLHGAEDFALSSGHISIWYQQDKIKRRCKKKRNKARGFPRYGSPRALIYHTAKKNYLILKKRVQQTHRQKIQRFLPIIRMLKNIFFRLLF